MRERGWFFVASLVAATAAYWPARSHACSCAVDFVNTKPGDSESGWPRNRAIELTGYLVPESVTLKKVDGEAHEFTLNVMEQTGPCGGGYDVELIPSPAL